MDTSTTPSSSSSSSVAPPTIRSLPPSSIHRLTAAQVILTLPQALKELLENALDAHSTSLTIKFSHYGLKAFSVADNGTGIASSNWESIAKKYCTSKLHGWEDLAEGKVQTFGFRGEALASLCALSGKVECITATQESAPIGHILPFTSSGSLAAPPQSCKKVARQRGTTVSIEGLFANLPVRRKEFEKNYKREYAKCQAWLQAYALVSKGVRWSVENVPDGGRKQISLNLVPLPPPSSLANSTSNTIPSQFKNTLRAEEKAYTLASLQHNVTVLFGAKVASGLIELSLHLDMPSNQRPKPESDEILPPTSSPPSSSSASNPKIRIHGLISRPSSSFSQSTSGRQFYYINTRPWDPPARFIKAFNDVYRSFHTNDLSTSSALGTSHSAKPSSSTGGLTVGGSQASSFPFVIADFHLPPDVYDINVSPDKRTIWMHNERAIADALRDALEEFYRPHRSVFTMGAAASQSQGLSLGETQGKGQRTTVAPRKSFLQTKLDMDLSNTESSDAVDETRRDDHDMESSEPDSVEDQELRAEVEEEEEEEEKSAAAVEAIGRPSRGHGSSSDRVPHQDEGGSSLASAPAYKITHLVLPQAKPAARATTSPQTTWTRPSNGHGPTKLHLPQESALFPPSKRRKMMGDDSSDEEEVTESRRAGSPTVLDDEEGEQSDADTTARETVTEDAREEDVRDDLSQRDGDEPFDEAVGDEINLSDEEREEQAESMTSAFDIDADDHATSAANEEERQRNLARLDEGRAEEPDEQSVMKSSASAIPIVSANSEARILYINIDAIRRAVTKRRDAQLTRESLRATRSTASRTGEMGTSAAGFQNEDADAAEGELSRTIHQEDFLKNMQVAGQFNLAFIIARRAVRRRRGRGMAQQLCEDESIGEGEDAEGREGVPVEMEDDLFIVDQHAADEKYNFEELQRETTIRSQPLIHPRTLELSAADEMVAFEHQDALAKSGYVLEYDEGAMPGRKVRLLSQPVSKGVVFGVKDLEELLHLLGDVPSGSRKAFAVRCSKARAMFAMRACRKSVMVGKALNKRQMGNILRHMGSMQQPWNCPHGRPTMRHLANLRGLGIVEKGRQVEGFARGKVDWGQFGA